MHLVHVCVYILTCLGLDFVVHIITPFYIRKQWISLNPDHDAHLVIRA
jgi:hypothetical protein